MPDPSTELARLDDLLIGRTAMLERVYVSIRLSRGVGTTVDHEDDVEYRSLSMTWATKSPFRRDFDRFGQVPPEARVITKSVIPMFDVDMLNDVWERWNLNDLRAACVHQARRAATLRNRAVSASEPDFTRYLIDNVPPCRHTGYRWGTRWLVEPLPEQVYEDLLHFITTHTKG